MAKNKRKREAPQRTPSAAALGLSDAAGNAARRPAPMLLLERLYRFGVDCTGPDSKPLGIIARRFSNPL